ncbi:MAG: aminoglycoside phosphotransferase family protein [Candidatus Bathyarchaeia archaeon]
MSLKFKVGPTILKLKTKDMESYLAKLFNKPVKIISLERLGEGFHNAVFSILFKKGKKKAELIIRIVRGDTGWGHDYASDRASTLLLQHRLLNMAPKHTARRSLDVFTILKNGKIVSLGDYIEFFNLVEKVSLREWKPYSEDLFEVARRGFLDEKDIKRCRTIADYIADLHSVKIKNENLYKRHIRDLIGHGEMMMGVIDTYPEPEKLEFASKEELIKVEVKAVEWRGRIKHLFHRLSRIHGDFHPFGNILFDKKDRILAIDQSREEYGEPADDVTSLSINYIFLSVWHYGEYRKPFSDLFEVFFERYIEKTNDEEIFKVMAPFYAFRGLVVAHPLYYPALDSFKRRKMMNFIINVLNSDEFDPSKVAFYLERAP